VRNYQRQVVRAQGQMRERYAQYVRNYVHAQGQRRERYAQYVRHVQSQYLRMWRR
jgi:hypothetical protein